MSLPCDIEGCWDVAEWVYIGESGDLYLCGEHYSPPLDARPWARITDRAEPS